MREGDDGVFARIVPGMSARCGDAAAESQLAMHIVEQRVPGSLRTESFRLAGIPIEMHGDSRNGRRALPQIALHPRFRGIARCKKQNVDLQAPLAVAEETIQFSNRGTGARTFRMSEQEKRRTPLIALNPCLGRPVTGRYFGATGGALVTRQHSKACRDGKQPENADESAKGNQASSNPGDGRAFSAGISSLGKPLFLWKTQI